MELTHKRLVEMASCWLRVSKFCNPVFTEKGSANLSEFPDAIGWTANDCIVVECKTSKQDFNNDIKKECRTNKEGLGNKRYYLLPRAIYEKVQIPDGWGVLIAEDYRSIARQERFKGSKEFDRNHLKEIYFLRSRILEIQRFGT